MTALNYIHMGIEGKQHAGVQDKVVYLDRCINAYQSGSKEACNLCQAEKLCIQPRTQGLSSWGEKTLVDAGHAIC